MPDRTPAEALRMWVVLTVLIGIQLLAFGLYALIGVLVYRQGADAVPDALWLAAGTYGGAMVTWLVNSKGGNDSAPAGTPSDPVTVTATEPLEVTSSQPPPAEATTTYDYTPATTTYGISPDNPLAPGRHAVRLVPADVGADLPVVALDDAGHADHS